MSVVQEVQSALSGMDVLSDEPDGYARGSTQSLVVPTNATSGPKRAETFSGFDYKLKPDNIYRASSMRVPERPGMSAGFPSRQLPAASATTGESPKLRHKRKTSGGSWPFLPKGSSKDDKEQSGERGDEASDSSFSPSPSLAPGREPARESDSERSVEEPSTLSKIESLQSRLRSAPKDGLTYISSPPTNRGQNRLLPGQDAELEMSRHHSDKSPNAVAPDVIYF